jgi:hypothetical protein
MTVGVLKASFPAPKLAIDGPSVVEVVRTDTVALQMAASMPLIACKPNLTVVPNMGFSWTETSGLLTSIETFKTVTPRTLRIPSGSLTPGATYTFTGT